MKGETTKWSVNPETIIRRVQERVENVIVNVIHQAFSHNGTETFEKGTATMQKCVSKMFLEKYGLKVEEEPKPDFVEVFKTLLQSEVETMVPKVSRDQYIEDYEKYILHQLRLIKKMSL